MGKRLPFREILCCLLRWIEKVFEFLQVGQLVRYKESNGLLLVGDDRLKARVDTGIVVFLICLRVVNLIGVF